jgi:hypothetical protein
MESVSDLIAAGRMTFNLFDQHRSSVYLDGKFIGWLSYSPGQSSKFIFGHSGYAWTGETREESIGKWMAETTKAPDAEAPGA